MPGSRRAELPDSSDRDRSGGGTADQVPGPSEETLGCGGTTPPAPADSSAPGPSSGGTGRGFSRIVGAVDLAMRREGEWVERHPRVRRVGVAVGLTLLVVAIVLWVVG